MSDNTSKIGFDDRVCVLRCGGHDMVTTGLWDHLREIRRKGASLLSGLSEGRQTSLAVLRLYPTLITCAWVTVVVFSPLTAGCLFVYCVFVSSRYCNSVCTTYHCVFSAMLKPCTVYLFTSSAVCQLVSAQRTWAHTQYMCTTMLFTQSKK